MTNCYLALANGRVFAGTLRGAQGAALGELTFTTGMGGYVETLTDPRYFGQIILFTFPLIGNYGMIPADIASAKCHARAVIARELCDDPSNFRSSGTLEEFLCAQGVPCVCGVDTREITRVIREAGVMNAAVLLSPPTDADFARIRAYRVENALAGVARHAASELPARGDTQFRVALVDLGAPGELPEALTKRGCRVRVLPHDTPAETLLANDIDGVALSGGPGDPMDCAYQIAQIKQILGKKPILGMGLGHQLLALAAGGRTIKLQFGHRGANQPVRRLSDGRMFITSQNHGYAVDDTHLPDSAEITCVNANDLTCEGLRYPALRAVSAQYAPDADALIALMKGNCHAKG